jgi:protein-S-isoprenylcysteine O-methyltransferase Ste14
LPRECEEPGDLTSPLLSAMATFKGVSVENAMLEQRTQTPSPAPGLIPAETERLTLIGNSHSNWYSKRGHVTKTIMPIRNLALAAFLLSGAFQAWAMIVNPFFSPAVRIQTERGHHLILTGPYQLMRHPGYFAMSISVPASALAIGSWIALMPAAGFVLLIKHRAHLEDEFLRNNLPGYIAYATRVGGPYAR